MLFHTDGGQVMRQLQGYRREQALEMLEWGAPEVEELMKHLSDFEPFFISTGPRSWRGTN